MRFETIKISNYRQYRDVSFEFHKSTANDIHIIIASNGVGKTNVLNAINWCLYGDDKRKEMDRDLKPEYLLDDLRRYQDVFGEEFGVKELLMLEDIRVKAMIAGALADMPEFLVDQIGKANNSSSFPSVTRAMERIADVVEEKWEEERE